MTRQVLLMCPFVYFCLVLSLFLNVTIMRLKCTVILFTSVHQADSVNQPMIPLSERSLGVYTTFTNFSMKYLVMCKVYTDMGGIK